jgi:hypothetical protein
MNDRIAQNPYKILGVSRLASNAEITKAFSVAMKERKYPPEAIAKARKSLMNPDERILADYLSPAIPPVKRFRSSITDREVQSEERLHPAQVDRLIRLEIDKLERENRDAQSDRTLANLVWESY